MAEKLSADQVKEMIDSGTRFHLVETLMEKEYNEWHLPGAINIHFNKIGGAAREQFQEDDTIVVYCHDEACNASPIAAGKLEKMGYAHVYEFPGGKKAWKAAGYPTES